MHVIVRILFIILFCFYISAKSIADTNEPSDYKAQFENLVFSGGGVLGIAYLGSLEAIDSNIKPLSQIKKYAGTSVGSIIATMSALRYSVPEMKYLIQELDFKNIAKKNFSNFVMTEDIFGDDIIDLYKAIDFISNKDNGYGINDGAFLEEWIEDIIAKKTGKEHATFADLSQNSAFADLHITASDIQNEKIVVFSARNTPDVVISKAVHASAAVPILFKVVKIKDGVYVDGGIYDLFPLDVFYQEPLYKTLGINFTNHHVFQNQSQKDKNIDHFNWQKYILSAFTATFISQYNQYTNSNYADHIITIDTLGIDPLNFSLSHQQKIELMHEGHQCALHWFNHKQ